MGMRNITDQLLLLCWKTKVILRASGSRCSSYCLFLTEHNSCSFPWSTPAVHRASAAWGLEVESTWGPHPWYRWDYFIMIPVQCLEVRCWMVYGAFVCVFSFLYPTLLWILYVFGWEGDLALYIPNRCIVGGLAFHMHVVIVWKCFLFFNLIFLKF